VKTGILMKEREKQQINLIQHGFVQNIEPGTNRVHLILH
jgi:hypothetical protein